MKKINKEDKKAITFVILFMIALAMTAFVAYNYQNQYLISSLKFIVLFALIIVALEIYLSVRENEGQYLGEYRKIVIIVLLVLKGVLISFSFVLISLLAILTILTFFTEYAGRTIFNTMFTSTFILALVLYTIYQKMNVPQKLSELYVKFKVTKKLSSPILDDSPYKKDVINSFDLLSVFLSVLLLANSTYSTFDPIQFNSEEEFFDAFEINFLLWTMPVYILSAYHRLPIKQNQTN